MDPEKMFSDNALVTVADFGGRYFAMCETPFLLEINPDTLEVKDRVSVPCSYLVVAMVQGLFGDQ